MTTISIALLALVRIQDSAPFKEAPVNLAPSQVHSTFTVGAFLENLTALANGDLMVTSYVDGTVNRVKPDGSHKVFATTGGKIAGIAPANKGGFIVSGWTNKNKACIYEIDSKGSVTTTTTLDGGAFPNGVERIAQDRYLIADSYAGLIWNYDSSTHTASVWLRDQTMDRLNLKDGTPAINGVRRFKNYVYYSNTNAHKFFRVKLGKGTVPDGLPELIIDGVNFDDFAFDTSGNVYAATHVLNSVQKLSPQGKLTTIAGLEQGLAGSTSATFGRAPGTRNTLYIATNGGMSVAPPSGVQPGKIVAIQIVPDK